MNNESEKMWALLYISQRKEKQNATRGKANTTQTHGLVEEKMKKEG
jgi:hypothetical protein